MRGSSCSITLALTLSCATTALAAPPPLPEGQTGIAARYPNDQDIESDPQVIFADDFEGYTDPSQLWDRWDVVFQTDRIRLASEPDNVYAGAQALEFEVPQQQAELSNATDKLLEPELDVLYLRFYAKFEPPYDVVGSSHNGAMISAHYFVNGQATPGIPADGTNKFECSRKSRSDFWECVSAHRRKALKKSIAGIATNIWSRPTPRASATGESRFGSRASSPPTFTICGCVTSRASRSIASACPFTFTRIPTARPTSGTTVMAMAMAMATAILAAMATPMVARARAPAAKQGRARTADPAIARRRQPGARGPYSGCCWAPWRRTDPDVHVRQPPPVAGSLGHALRRGQDSYRKRYRRCAKPRSAGQLRWTGENRRW